MAVYTKPQQRKKEESEKPRRERDEIKFIHHRLERWQVVRFKKARSSINCIFLGRMMIYEIEFVK